MDFIIDTTGSHAPPEESGADLKDCSIVSKLLEEFKSESVQTSTVTKHGKKPNNVLGTFFDEMGWTDKKPKANNVLDEVQKSKLEVKEALKKSVLTPEFEKAHTVPQNDLSERILKKQNKQQAELTKGKKWFGLPATEMTDEIKRDMEVLQMRSVLDSKRFYKKNDLKVLPKYFQVGKVLDSPLDYYNDKLTKKERKTTLVDELLADTEFNKYNKRKYKEIIQERQKTHYKAWRQAKRLKKKK